MNLLLRPPFENEWPVCRKLLPETFSEVDARQYRVCISGESRRVAGAVSWLPREHQIAGLRIHVLPSFRRQGVGSQIIEQLAEQGRCALDGTAEIHGQSFLAEFCARNGMERVATLTTVEADMEPMCEHLRHIRARLPMPPNARLVRLHEAPPEGVARLHAQYVARIGSLNPWRAIMAQSEGMKNSPVMMVDDQVAGILLGQTEDGLTEVRSWAVAAEQRGNWMSTVLLAEGLEIAWGRGARRVRFSFTEANRDTGKLAARFQARVVSIVGQFRRLGASGVTHDIRFEHSGEDIVRAVDDNLPHPVTLHGIERKIL